MLIDLNQKKPIIFLAFANDLPTSGQYLYRLKDEAELIESALKRNSTYEVVVCNNATVENVFEAFREYRDRIIIFHFGGHANGYEIYFENTQGGPVATRSEGLAAFLGLQQNLKLVFLNGCASGIQARNLLAANIDVVIATERDIKDEDALDFAENFYLSLASGATLKAAYHEAAAAVQASANRNHRQRHLQPQEIIDTQLDNNSWPWNIYVRPRNEANLQWVLVNKWLQQTIWLITRFFIPLVIISIAIYFYIDLQSDKKNADIVEQQLKQQEGQRLYDEAEQFKLNGKMMEAIDAYTKAATLDPTLNINLVEQQEDIRRQAAILLIHAGEDMARTGDLIGAAEKYQAALNLEPPLDTPVYVQVEAGEFTMGSTEEEIRFVFDLCQEEHMPCEYSWFEIEKPQHAIQTKNIWILRTEVTNSDYSKCVNASICKAPNNEQWNNPDLEYMPVAGINWHQAYTYAKWRNGRLPTEAEWEKACRGIDARSYPWGNQLPISEFANFKYYKATITEVGTYPEGKSPYGLLDMSGNVWEWTNSQNKGYPYQADDGREDISLDNDRILRGGAFSVYTDGVRCTSRIGRNAGVSIINAGFRIVAPGF